MAKEWLIEVLSRRRYPHEQPTPTHYTLEVSAYWNNDLLDQIESGRRRKVVVGGYRKQRPDLVVEVTLPASRFQLAQLDGPSALITVPREAEFAMRREDGSIDWAPPQVEVKSKFPAFGMKMGLADRVAFQLDKLTFVLTFVHLKGKPRSSWDWVFARRLG